MNIPTPYETALIDVLWEAIGAARYLSGVLVVTMDDLRAIITELNDLQNTQGEE